MVQSDKQRATLGQFHRRQRQSRSSDFVHWSTVTDYYLCQYFGKVAVMVYWLKYEEKQLGPVIGWRRLNLGPVIG